MDKEVLEHRGFFRYTVVASAACLLFICALPGNNLINWVRAKRDIRKQNESVEYINSQIEKIDREISTLRDNPDSLERFAREQFQYAAPGDDVYIIEK